MCKYSYIIIKIFNILWTHAIFGNILTRAIMRHYGKCNSVNPWFFVLAYTIWEDCKRHNIFLYYNFTLYSIVRQTQTTVSLFLEQPSYKRHTCTAAAQTWDNKHLNWFCGWGHFRWPVILGDRPLQVRAV